jgi:hypothetical protein
VLLVVRGADADAELAVRRGAQQAGTPTRPRWVVWVPNPTLVDAELAQLPNHSGGDVATAIILSQSFGRDVRFVLARGNPPTEGRVLRAYTRAEASS